MVSSSRKTRVQFRETLNRLFFIIFRADVVKTRDFASIGDCTGLKRFVQMNVVIFRKKSSSSPFTKHSLNTNDYTINLHITLDIIIYYNVSHDNLYIDFCFILNVSKMFIQPAFEVIKIFTILKNKRCVKV